MSRDDNATVLDLDETRGLFLPALDPLASLQLQLSSPDQVCRVAVPKVNCVHVTHVSLLACEIEIVSYVSIILYRHYLSSIFRHFLKIIVFFRWLYYPGLDPGSLAKTWGVAGM